VYIYEVLVYSYLRMKNDNKARQSTAYRFTIDITSEADKIRLKALRAATALKNKLRDDRSVRLEVAVRPRLGVGSKFKALYSRKGPFWADARQGNYKMEHATRADVYVYTRRVNPWGNNNY